MAAIQACQKGQIVEDVDRSSAISGNAGSVLTLRAVPERGVLRCAGLGWSRAMFAVFHLGGEVSDERQTNHIRAG
jgi:hypothetical protein